MMTGRPARDLAVVAVAVVLGAALLFGLWHVLVGGIISGNERAATFGVALSVVAGGLLGAVTALGRRLRRG